MYEGKPLILLVGSTDTGRTPLAAALLRRALAPQAIVLTAGVLSHAGDSAPTEAQMAAEQLGLDISRHVARPLQHDEHGPAELLLAVDRGTELVLLTMFRDDPRVACLSALAEQPDVLDPHRMPLGVWIAALRQLDEHIRAALPLIRQRLGLTAQSVDALPIEEPHTPEPPIEMAPPAGWASDEQMQRLMGLIHSPAPDAEPAVASNGAASNGAAPAAPPAIVAEHVDAAEHVDDRAAQVARMLRMLDVAAELPEIIDWLRLHQTLVAQLRAVAQHSAGPLDFAPAAVLMIEGKLAQQPGLPHPDALDLLRRAIGRLSSALPAEGLAAIGTDLAQW